MPANSVLFRAVILFILSINFLSSCGNKENNTILIFAASVTQPAMEECIILFEKETGTKVEVIFGASGQVLTQMMLSKQGDIYFAGSSDYMEIAKEKELVLPQSEQTICYLVPAINVQKGNPKNIHALKDLLNPKLKVAIANPNGVCVGIYAVEIIEKSFDENEKKLFRKNVLNYLGSCSKTATAISLKSVDAVLGWRVFQYWNPNAIETVALDKSQIVRVGYVPIALSKFTKNKLAASKFIELLSSERAKKIFQKHHYFPSKQAAFDYIGEKKALGGVYSVPQNWIDK